MIDTRRLKRPSPDPGGVLLFVSFETDRTIPPRSGTLSAVLKTLSQLPLKVLSVEVSVFSSHLLGMVGLSLSPSTTEKSAVAVMRELTMSIENASKPCKISEMHGVLAPGLESLLKSLSSQQN